MFVVTLLSVGQVFFLECTGLSYERSALSVCSSLYSLRLLSCTFLICSPSSRRCRLMKLLLGTLPLVLSSSFILFIWSRVCLIVVSLESNCSLLISLVLSLST